LPGRVAAGAVSPARRRYRTLRRDAEFPDVIAVRRPVDRFAVYDPNSLPPRKPPLDLLEWAMAIALAAVGGVALIGMLR
jgi:hypothetical protein